MVKVIIRFGVIAFVLVMLLGIAATIIEAGQKSLAAKEAVTQRVTGGD